MADSLGIILTSHQRQQMFWEQALGSLKGYKGLVLLAYDDRDDRMIRPFVESMKEHLPALEVICSGKEQLSPEHWELKLGGVPKQSARFRHIRGEMSLIKEAGRSLADLGYKYFLKSAADNTLYRYYNLPKIVKLLQRTRFIICGTAVMAGHVDLLNEFLDGYESTKKIGGAEFFFYRRLKGVNHLRKKQPWWESLLGHIHVQGEYARGMGISVGETWRVGELWPRASTS